MGLTSGYVMRALDQLPVQGTQAPWRVQQNYIRDRQLLRYSRVDEQMEFRARERASSPLPLAA
jgi:monooxygenase